MKEILIETLVFFPFILGPLISYKMAGFTDLAMEGIFVFIPIIIYNLFNHDFMPSFIALSIIIGIMRYQTSSILFGIIILTLLQSINLILLKSPLQTLLELPQITLFYLLLINTILIILYYLFSQSHLGLLTIGMKHNVNALKNTYSNLRSHRFTIYGISYFFIGIAGILSAVHQQFLSISMGAGNIMLALGMIILGKKLPYIFLLTFGYFATYHFFVYYECNPLFLKIFIGLFFGILYIKNNYKEKTLC